MGGLSLLFSIGRENAAGLAVSLSFWGRGRRSRWAIFRKRPTMSSLACPRPTLPRFVCDDWIHKTAGHQEERVNNSRQNSRRIDRHVYTRDTENPIQTGRKNQPFHVCFFPLPQTKTERGGKEDEEKRRRHREMTN